MATFKKPESEHGVFAIRDVRVIDGDALEATICLPFDALIRKRIRLRGWWADEVDGQYAEAGKLAKQRLEGFVKSGPLWIHAADERLDRYGRLLATLRDAQRIIPALEILKELQLSESEHKRRRDAIVKQQKAQRAIITSEAVDHGYFTPKEKEDGPSWP